MHGFCWVLKEHFLGILWCRCLHIHTYTLCIRERLSFQSRKVEFQRETERKSFGSWREKEKKIRYIPTLYIKQQKKSQIWWLL
jgi:hypothetical protein